MTANFIHLNCHTSYSLLESSIKVGDLVKKAEEFGQPAIGITDSNNLFGAVEVATKLPDAGIQPIMGIQLGVQTDAGALGHVHLLTQSEAGWHNLLTLSSQASMDREGTEKPFVSVEFLCQHAEGLILLTGGLQTGLLSKVFDHAEGDNSPAQQLLETLKNSFTNRLYIEIQRHDWQDEYKHEQQALKLAEQLNLPLVATNAPHFMAADGYGALQVLQCIGQGLTIDDPAKRVLSGEHYYKSPAQMLELFSDLPEACANTVAIAQRCAHWIERISVKEMFMPKWPIAEGEADVPTQLREQSQQGLDDLFEMRVIPSYPGDTNFEELRVSYQKRLDDELELIISMGFDGYFLITSDFIKWAKEQDIPVGPGRGSGAGSLVAWALSITDLDPIKWDLYFERFLNPERVSLPDFDVDFCQERREEVIQYVRDKYGNDHVANIITFGTLKARACIRDVGRVLQMPFGQVGRIAAFIPDGQNPPPISQVLEEDERLREQYDTEEDVKRLLDMALKLEGCYRHASTHAAGVEIADRPIMQVCPLYKDPRTGDLMTQWPWMDAEFAGLVKFDFLGLKTLSVIKMAVDLLKKRDIEVIPEMLPFDDEPVFEMLRAGHTVGVFQIESAGMTDMIKKIAPQKITDLSDAIALFRPGPLGSGMVDDLIECRHGRQEPNYPHELLQPVLEETFGVPVYQEQVMRMAQVMAGYTLGGADMLRRAMGKKKPAEMARQREIFVAGAADVNNIPAEKANEVFDLMAHFAGYGFNKAHTMAYAVVSYQTAWLKAHHPAEFMAASMTFDRGNTDKLVTYKQELVRMNMPLLPPDVNHSQVMFDVEPAQTEEGEDVLAVRYALAALKGAGTEAMRELVQEREQNGKYADIWDLMARQNPQAMNRKQLETLIAAGALDNFGHTRATLHEAIPILLGHCQAAHEQKTSNQIGLFGGEAVELPTPHIAQLAEWDLFTLLEHEQRVLGFYLSAHPLEAYAESLAKQPAIAPISQLTEGLGSKPIQRKVAAVVLGRREVKTKSGNRMGIITISDTSGQNEIAIFPETYAQVAQLLDESQALCIHVNASIDGERIRMNAEAIIPLEQQLKAPNDLNLQAENVVVLEQLKERLQDLPAGQTCCRISCPVEKVGIITFTLPKKKIGQREIYSLRHTEGVILN